MDTKTVYAYAENGEYIGTKILDNTDRSPSGAWNIPANCTEIAPPTFDSSKQVCVWDSNGWTVTDTPTAEKPEPTEEEKLANAKSTKEANIKGLLFATDYFCLKHADGALTDEEYAPVKTYRAGLRTAYNAVEVATTITEIEAVVIPSMNVG